MQRDCLAEAEVGRQPRQAAAQCLQWGAFGASDDAWQLGADLIQSGVPADFFDQVDLALKVAGTPERHDYLVGNGALGDFAPQTAQDNPGLLRLKNENGHYVLELDGAPVERALSPEKKKRLIELITIFRPWLDGGQPSQAEIFHAKRF